MGRLGNGAGYLHLAGMVHAGCAEAVLELAGVESVEPGHLRVKFNARCRIILALCQALASFRCIRHVLNGTILKTPRPDPALHLLGQVVQQ